MKKIRNVGTIIMNSMREFASEESGMGTVEVILIVIVLISFVFLFKDSLTTKIGNWLKNLGDDKIVGPKK